MAPGLNLTLSNFHSKHISSAQSFQKAWTDLERRHASGRKGAVAPPLFLGFFRILF